MNKVPKNLNDYFDQEEFLEAISDNHSEEGNIVSLYVDFGTRLLDSRSFVHFMDGYIED